MNMQTGQMQPGMMNMQAGQMQPGMMNMQAGQMQPGMMNMQAGQMQPGMMNMQPGMMNMQPGMMNMQPGQMGMMNGQMVNSHGQIYPLQMMGMMNGVQPGQMVLSQGQMQPTQMGMMNYQFQQPGQMQTGQMANQPQGGNNPVPKPQSQPSKNICVEFYVNDTIIGVQGNSNMSIKQLIKNFKVKLCNENIKIAKYITHPNKIELDPNSEETLASKNIDEKIKINAIPQ
jgi:MAD (mothers against decapentaplegic) family protein 4